MAFEYQGRRFIEPQDLKIKPVDFLPRMNAADPTVKSELGRDFLGPDEIVALIQVAVARAVDYQSSLEEELLKIHESGKDIKDAIFRKNLSGIGRGHSLDGLPVVALGLNGTKMIDSAFTGVVYSRSLVPSGRRRATTTAALVVPRSISGDAELFREYLKISDGLFEVFGSIKERYGRKVDAIQAFNKLKPYNDPADLFYVVPLSSLVNLTVAVEREQREGTAWLPEECAVFKDLIEDMVDDMGIGQLYRMRKAVPRETYLHYNIFRKPESDYATAMHARLDNPLDPAIAALSNHLPDEALADLAELKKQLGSIDGFSDARDLYARACTNRDELADFCRRYNEALNIQTVSTLSWRVWSEQKRHGTLRQHVESVYTAADRAFDIVRGIWPAIEAGNITDELTAAAEKAFIIASGIKAEAGMLKDYIYHSARQIMFYGRLVEKGIPPRDALYIVPRNIRMRTLESYDLINAASLELPLRLCTECEPERRESSEMKARLFKEALPEMDFLFEPKCNLGYCTEGNFCGNIKRLNSRYNVDLHKEMAGIISGLK